MSVAADVLWKRFCEAEDEFFAARMALVKSGEDLEPLIGVAMGDPGRRPTALRLLEILPEAASRNHLQALVVQATGSQRDIAAARRVLGRIDREWLRENIELAVACVFRVDGDDDEWTYRRVAELYQELQEPRLLAEHLRRCSEHRTSEVREIADDFRSRTPGTPL
jgi:hypothetical protein